MGITGFDSALNFGITGIEHSLGGTVTVTVTVTTYKPNPQTEDRMIGFASTQPSAGRRGSQASVSQT